MKSERKDRRLSTIDLQVTSYQQEWKLEECNDTFSVLREK